MTITPAERLLLKIARHVAGSIELGGWRHPGEDPGEFRQLMEMVEAEIERRASTELAGALTREDLMAYHDDVVALTAAVRANQDATAAAVHALQGVTGLLQAAYDSGDQAAMQEAIAAVKSNTASLAAAIPAGTPAGNSGTASSTGAVAAGGTVAGTGSTAAAGGTVSAGDSAAAAGTVAAGGTVASAGTAG